MELNMCKAATTNEDDKSRAAAAEQNTSQHHRVVVIKDEVKDVSTTGSGKGCRLEKIQEKKNEIEKFKIENADDSTTELLGSVTTHNCPGTRTSARVIQKMKQDQTRPMTPPPSERDHHGNKKDDKNSQKTPSQVRSTHRTIWTNLERNFFFDALNEFGKDFEAIGNCINAKLKRRGTTDFPIKTKEQVRLHYYQTYHKICKYIKYSDEIKKPAQELYTLINYGEMRRKLQFLGEKHFMKLRQLVCQGHVTIRFKGKNIRIKTPSCKALRRLNQLDDTLEDIRLPTKIEVIVSPANMEAFGRVQALAQNPRVRATVPLHKKLSNFIKTFQYKWRSQNCKLAEEEQKLFPTPLANNDVQTGTTTTETFSTCYQDPEICFRPKPGVHIHRPLLSITEYLSSVNICLSSYEERLGVKVRSESLTYGNNKRQRTESGSDKRSPDTKKLKQLQSPAALESKTLEEATIATTTSTTTTMHKQEEQMAVNESDSVAKVDNNSSDELSDELQELLNEISESLVVEVPNVVPNVPVVIADAPQPSSRSSTNNNNNNKRNVNSNGTNSSTSTSNNSGGKANSRLSPNFKPLLNDESIKSIRKGWTISQAADITIGDLYVVIGQDSKLELDYYWRDETPATTAAVITTQAATVTTTTTAAAATTPTFQTPTTSSIVPSAMSIQNEQINVSPFTGSNFLLKELRKPETNMEEPSEVVRLKSLKTLAISNKLKHLLLIANLNERARKKQCLCGHSCERNATKTRIERDLAKTYISGGIAGAGKNSDVDLFRQPAVPVHKPISIIDPIHQPFARQKISRHVLVQRRLLQPGRAYQQQNLHNDNNLLSLIRKVDINDIEKTSNTKNWPKTKQQQQIVKTPQQNIKNPPSNSNSLQTPAAATQMSLLCDNTNTNNSSNAFTITNNINTTTQQLSSNNYSNSSDTLYSNNFIDNNTTSTPLSTDSSNQLEMNNKYASWDNSGITVGPSMPSLEASEPETHLISTVPECAYDESTSTNFFNGMMSPMHLIRESTSSNSRWLEENLNDFSLTSLLGHLDEINATRDILDPSSNMSVISESSVDYRHKFQEITALMQNQEKD